MLPDSQMDRFAVRLSLGYPAAKEELTMVMNRQKSNPLKELTPLVTKEQLGRMQEEVANTYIGEAVVQYAVDLIHLTRKLDCIQQGASPRATLMVVSMAKALAQLRGRDYVIPQDVQDAFDRGDYQWILETFVAPHEDIEGLSVKEISVEENIVRLWITGADHGEKQYQIRFHETGWEYVEISTPG